MAIFLYLLCIAQFFLRASSAAISKNWRDYIAKDTLEKYDGKHWSEYSDKHFRDITGINKDLLTDAPKSVLNNVITGEKKRWLNRLMPYTLSDEYNINEKIVMRNLIHVAMDIISSSTGRCIKFIRRSNEEYYIYVIRGLDYHSQAGGGGGKQEQSRADRDKYVWIDWENLLPAMKAGFNISTDATTFGLPYDYDSILRYVYNAAAVDSHAPTIVPKEKRRRIGQRTELSVLDILKPRKAYNCPDAGEIPMGLIIPSHQTAGITERSSTNQETNHIATAAQVATTGQTMIHVQQIRLKRADLALPDFKRGNLSDVECKALNTENCFIESWANCLTGFFAFHCEKNSTEFEIRSHLEKIKSTVPSSPIVFAVGGENALKPETFQSVSDNIIYFKIYSANSFNCDVLKDLSLPNLLELQFMAVTNITINRDSLRPFQKMRILSFWISTILSLEKESLESLVNLKTLVFAAAIKLPFSSDERSHLWRLHCSAEYSWLRDYLTQHQELIQPRKSGEIYSILGIISWPYSKQDTSYPVDCSRCNLTGDQNQDEFSINVQLSLPDFKIGSLRDVECKALNTDNCFVEPWANCLTGLFAFYCNGLSTEFEISSHLKKINSAVPSSPIVFAVGGENALKPETFQLVSNNIVIFSINWTNGFNCDVWRDLPLPNLLELHFYQSTNITINRNSLTSFQKLRALAFLKSTILWLEKGSLESLGSLKIVAFNWGITSQFSSDERSYLWRIHCSAEYSWLRDYLDQHPQLLQPRKQGEICSLPGFENVEWTRQMIFYPVDCSRNDLTGDQNQMDFSINVQLSLPDFKKGNLSDEKCKGLNTENCFIQSWANCLDGKFAFHCEEKSTEFEIRSHLEKISWAIPSSPIEFGIGGKNELKPETFQSVSDNIVFFRIYWTNGFNCDVLRDLPLPNLLYMQFDVVTNITINRDSLRQFKQIRCLLFWKSTILSLVQGSLESLIKLETLGFDNGIILPLSSNDWSYLWRMHCSAEYSWLRDLLNQHPKLIQPRKAGDIYSLPGMESQERSRRDLYYPVDCSRDDLTGDQNQTEFSINVQLSLQDFKKGNLTDVQCKALNTEHCFVESWANCPNGNFVFECKGSSTDAEIRTYLEKIRRAIPFSPFRFTIFKTKLKSDTFQSVSGNIVNLQIHSTDNFECDVLKDLLLPNLLELTFSFSTNIAINHDSLRPFRNMRNLFFDRSTIISLEKGSLDSLISLKTVAFDWNIPLSFNLHERSYLWRLHCSAEYSWLRDYLDQHPELIKPRETGEIFSLSGATSVGLGIRNLFYPVDCSRDDLTGDQNQTEFSLNVKLSLPDFKIGSLSDVECKALNTGNCFVESLANCPTGYFVFECNGSSTDFEISSHLERIKRTVPSGPFQFIINGKTELKPQTFKSVSDNIIHFEIRNSDGFNCNVLTDLPLPNLLELTFSFSTNITIKHDSLRPFQKMRFLLFQKSTILSLEKGALESLISLKTVAFEWSITLPLSSDERSYLWSLHCSVEYLWLRDYLDEHPELIKPRKEGEVSSFRPFQNREWTRQEIFYPVDCSRDDLTGDQSQLEFSIQLSLANFQKGSLTEVECKAMNTDHCFVESKADCSNGFFGFACGRSSTDDEIKKYLEKFKSAIPLSPFRFAISKTELKSETIQSVSSNIVVFEIVGTDGFNCDVLTDLPLPNLLELTFSFSTNITINRDSLRPFRRMRVLKFQRSAILLLEKGSLESLVSLKTVAFDNSIALQLSLDERSHLWRLHCSAEYSWLRDYLDQRPNLIQPRKQGEIYSLPGVENYEWTRREIFYPVDCSRDDLRGDQDQVKFSLHAYGLLSVTPSLHW